MKTIVTASQKDGIGRAIAARNLAFFVTERGLRVLCVDLGPQKSLSKTLWTLCERIMSDRGSEL